MSVVETVRVLNQNRKGKLVDRLGGVEYEFPAGEETVVPRPVAEHIFGYGLSEKEREAKFRRSGLAMDPKGREIWNKFVVKEPRETGFGLNRISPASP